MKKKFLSSLLFATLVGGAVSTFTACKDYDDDINNIQAQVDDLEKLKAVKTEVDAAIASLKSQLEAADAQLQAAINEKADQADLSKLEARVVTLESKVATLEDAKTELEDKITTKVDKTDFDALYAKLLTVDGKLAEPLKTLVQDEAQALVDAAALNLQQQIDAISKMTEMPDGTKSPLVEALTTLKNNIGNYSISDLASQMQENSDAITTINSNLNLLTVLCQQGLRSLVFQPVAYYWGVEATRLFTLDGVKYNTQETDYNKFEKTGGLYTGITDFGYDTYNRYPTTPFFKILDFVATYHMNPSTAVLDKAKDNVTVISDDKEFVTRSAAANLGVADWKTENGNLVVNLTVGDKDAIKSVTADEAITVFAAQAHIGDTIITSDYATIVKKNISDVKLYHKVASDVNGEYGTYTSTVTTHPVTGAPVVNGFVYHSAANNATLGIPTSVDAGIPSWNEEVSEPSSAANKTRSVPFTRTLGPVLGTVKQTVDYFPQDWVIYDCNEVDLTKFVTVRVWDGTAPIEVDPAELGLKYKFELTALHLLNGAMVGDDGAANTSESAHSAIQGNMFRPQMVERATGAQLAYGSAQDIQTVGRTPVVRVSLVDDNDNVYDYGYFRILILNKSEQILETPVTVEYTGDPWSYAYECNAAAYNWQNTWAQVEYDLYAHKDVNMSRDQFVNNYYNTTLGTDGPVLKAGSSTEFQQYVKDANGNYVPATAAEEIGVVTSINGISADGTETSTLKWIVTGAQTLQHFMTGTQYNKTAAAPEVAVKYESLNKAVGPDIYVVIKAGAITVHPRPVANISWDAIKNPSYWYAKNSSVSATNGGTAIADAVEMHNNVLTPQDNTNTTILSKNFRQTISSTMLNNVISGNGLFVGWATAPAAQAAADYATTAWKNDLVFSKENDGKQYKGESGVTYTMKVSDDQKTLYAYITSATTKQPVAQIVGVGANAQQIVYGGNTAVNTPTADPFDFKDYGQWEYAKDLLNYKAHNALDDNTIRAIVGVNINNSCNMEIAHNDATFDVRFLRPINVADKDKTIEDANTTALQTFDIADLIGFTDWREDWKTTPSYITYYGIKSISIDGLVGTGDKLSNNANVITNQSGSDKALKDVNAAIDFIYTAPATGEIAGKLTYKNFSSTVDEFYVKIPVTVEYFWGKISTTVTVNVKRTAGGNAPRK